MKKIFPLIFIVILISVSFAYADSDIVFETHPFTDSMTVPSIAAAILNDYETTQNENLQVVGCTYIKYRYNNADTIFLDYYLVNPVRSLNVFPDGEKKATASFQPINLTSGTLNEKTSESLHKTIVNMHKNAKGVQVLKSEFVKASEITQAWMSMNKITTATDDSGIIGKWYNIKGNDTYTFDENGIGLHDTLSITYSVSDDHVFILENISDIMPNELVVDQKMGFTRLIASDTYYVQEQEYYRLSSSAREQTTKILTSVEFWKAKAAVNYLQFTEGGGGWFLVQGETDPLKWEFVDNDTIKLTVTTSVGTNTLTVNVVNKQGTYQLTDDAGNVKYTPKK